jgi:hypothetical protein
MAMELARGVMLTLDTAALVLGASRCAGAALDTLPTVRPAVKCHKTWLNENWMHGYRHDICDDQPGRDAILPSSVKMSPYLSLSPFLCLCPCSTVDRRQGLARHAPCETPSAANAPSLPPSDQVSGLIESPTCSWPNICSLIKLVMTDS